MYFVKLCDIVIDVLIFIGGTFLMLKNTSRFKKLCKSAAAVLIGLQLAITSLVPVMAEDISLSDTSKASTYKIADLDVAVTVSDDLVCFTQNVTSNNSYLDLIGADDVEQLRALMKVNNIYLEIIPKQNVTYEILLSGKDAPSGVESLNDLSDDELQSSFKSYVESRDNTKNEIVTENITNSYIDKINGVTYFVTDVTSIANNDVTVYLRKYYTIMRGKAISFSLQTNQSVLTDNMKTELENIVKTTEYKNIKKSIFDNPIYLEIMTTVLSLLLPIAILALIVFFITNSAKRKKKKH